MLWRRNNPQKGCIPIWNSVSKIIGNLGSGSLLPPALRAFQSFYFWILSDWLGWRSMLKIDFMGKAMGYAWYSLLCCNSVSYTSSTECGCARIGRSPTIDWEEGVPGDVQKGGLGRILCLECPMRFLLETYLQLLPCKFTAEWVFATWLACLSTVHFKHVSLHSHISPAID